MLLIVTQNYTTVAERECVMCKSNYDNLQTRKASPFFWNLFKGAEYDQKIQNFIAILIKRTKAWQMKIKIYFDRNVRSLVLFFSRIPDIWHTSYLPCARYKEVHVTKKLWKCLCNVIFAISFFSTIEVFIPVLNKMTHSLYRCK